MTGLLRDAFGATLVLLGFSVMTDRATVLLADKLAGPRAGDIGDNPREYEFEPLTAPSVPEPVRTPSPTPSVPEPVKEPAHV